MSQLPGLPMQGQHDQAAPTTTPTGLFGLGIANAVATPVGEGDAAAASLTLNRNTRVITPKEGVPVSFTDGNLAAGDSTVTFRTVPAGRFARLVSCQAAYTGTMTGVSLQLVAGGVIVDVAIGSLASGVFVPLLPAGMVIPLTAAAVYAINVVGATLNDNLDVRAHFEEEVI